MKIFQLNKKMSRSRLEPKTIALNFTSGYCATRTDNKSTQIIQTILLAITSSLLCTQCKINAVYSVALSTFWTRCYCLWSSLSELCWLVVSPGNSIRRTLEIEPSGLGLDSQLGYFCTRIYLMRFLLIIFFSTSCYFYVLQCNLH